MNKIKSLNFPKIRKLLMGSREKGGLLIGIAAYTLLISIGFIYVYPVLYMLSTSLMSPSDLLDSSTRWIPTTLHIKNYTDAFQVMEYIPTLFKNLQIAFFPTVAQLVVTSMAGYAFARYDFPLKKVWMVLLIFAFVIPPQITMIPAYVLQSQMGLIGSIWSFIVPAMLGQGFKSAIFILIFYNFHRQIPASLIEAAEIDGAGHLRTFFRIAVPLSVPAMIVTVLFSFVWYWNETYLVNLYLGFNNNRAGGLTTLLLELERFQASYDAIYSGWELSPNRLNEALRMSGTMLAIAPLMALYAILQRQFVESVDKSGITGE
jgi:multiple sugar transport system permease protein